MQWWKQFKPKACLLNLQATSKSEALGAIVEHMAESEVLARELAPAAHRALLEREELASTGVGQGVAIPHIKLPGLEHVACVLALHREGIAWSAIDGAPVQILFTVLRPEQAGPSYDPARHLEMMRWIAKLARDGDFRRFALTVRTKAELVDLLKEMSAA